MNKRHLLVTITTIQMLPAKGRHNTAVEAGVNSVQLNHHYTQCISATDSTHAQDTGVTVQAARHAGDATYQQPANSTRLAVSRCRTRWAVQSRL